MSNDKKQKIKELIADHAEIAFVIGNKDGFDDDEEAKSLEVVVSEILSLVDELIQERDELKESLRDLLNDCINFDGAKLTDIIIEEASKTLENKS